MAARPEIAAAPQMSASVLPTLKQLTLQMRQLGEHLPPYAGVLDPDNIAYIRDTSAALIGVLDGLSVKSGNPLGDRDVRHDLRNQVAVVKGFADLMMMDITPAHVVAPALKQLGVLADQFVAQLDSVKQESGGA